MHPNSQNQVRYADDRCRLVVVQDQLQPCPYVADATARMPLRLPVGTMTKSTTDHLLAGGYRRSGDFVYRTECPTCAECLPTRLCVDTFHWTRSFQRVRKRGDKELTCHWDAPRVDPRRVELFNRHRALRELGRGDEIDADSYRSFLVESCCESLELSVCQNDRLVAVAIVDVGLESVSSVYTFFAPELARYSLGTYALLKTIEWAHQTQHPLLYLGMYVAENRHLNYKARYVPQQRLIGGRWTDFDVDST